MTFPPAIPDALLRTFELLSRDPSEGCPCARVRAVPWDDGALLLRCEDCGCTVITPEGNVVGPEK